jgi:hypothetical protein
MRKILLLFALFASALLFPDALRADDGTLTDVLTAKSFGYTKASTSYESKSYTANGTGESGATYSGKMSCQNQSGTLYLCFKATDTGVWVSKAPEGYKLSKISYTYYTGNNKMYLYGGTDVYTAPPSEATKLQNELGATGSYTFTNNETAFCFSCNGGSKTSQWSNITVEWVPISSSGGESGGGTVTDAPAAPSISGEEMFVGSQTVSFSCDTDGVTFYYTLDGSDPTTESASGNSVTIDSSCTVKVIAVKDGTASKVTSKTFTAIPTVATIGEVMSSSDLAAGKYYCISGKVVVTYVYNKYLYIQDADAANPRGMAVFNNTASWDTATFAVGKVLENIIVKYNVNYGAPQFYIATGDDLTRFGTPSSSMDVAPVEMSVADMLNAENYHRYVTYTGAITKDSSKYYLVSGDSKVQLYKSITAVAIPTDVEDKLFTVVGFPTIYATSSASTPEILYISIDELKKPALPVVTYGAEYAATADNNATIGIDADTPLKVVSENATAIEVKKGDAEAFTTLASGSTYEGTAEYTKYVFRGVAQYSGTTLYSDEFTVAFEENTAAPEKPVITINEEALTGDAYTGVFGAKVSVSAENATAIKDGEGKEYPNPYEFTLPDVVSQAYTFYGANAKGQSAEAATFTFTALAPQNLTVAFENNTISTEEYAVLAGSSVTIKADGAAKYTANAAELTADENGVYSYTVNEFGTVTFTASNNVGDASQTITFTESKGKVFTLISGVDDLLDGGHYIIAYANGDSSKAMSTTNSSNAMQSTDVTITDNTITNPSKDVMVFTLRGDDDAWKWLNSDEKKGLNFANSTNLNLTDSPVTTKVASATSGFTIKSNTNTGSTARSILYDTSTKVFKNYATGNSYKTVSIYKLEEEIVAKPGAITVTYGEENTAAVDGETYAVDYNTTVKVYSKNASKFTVATGEENTTEVAAVENAYTFNVTAPATYTFTATNGDRVADKSFTVTFTVNPVALPEVKTGDKLFSDGESFSFNENASVTLTINAPEGCKAQYKKDSEENYADVVENTLVINKENTGTYSFISLETESNRVSDALTVTFVATQSHDAPTVSINNEQVTDFDEIYDVYGDTPVTLYAFGADKVKIVGEDNVENVYDMVDGAYTFYPTKSDILTITALYGEHKSEDAVMLGINLIKHAAPVVTLRGEAVAADASLSFYPAAKESVSVVAENAAKLVINSVETEGYATSFTAAAGEYTITAIYGENVESESISFTLTENHKPMTFELVENTDNLETGTYIIATVYTVNDEEKGYVMTATDINSNLLAGDVVINDNTAKKAENPAIFNVVKSGENWKLLTAGTAYGINVTSGKGGLSISNDKSKPAELQLSIADGETKICVAEDTRWIQFNYNGGSSPRFGYYAKATSGTVYGKVNLYRLAVDDTKEVAALSEIEDDVDMVYFTSELTINFAGINAADGEKEIWLYDANNGDRMHATIDEDCAASYASLGQGNTVSGFYLMGGKSEENDHFFEGLFISEPNETTYINDFVPKTEDELTHITAEELGKRVLVRANSVNVDSDMLIINFAEDSNYGYKYFRSELTESNSDNEGNSDNNEGNADNNEDNAGSDNNTVDNTDSTLTDEGVEQWSWDLKNNFNNWPTADIEATTYLSGIVASEESGDKVEYVLYLINMSTDKDVATIVDKVSYRDDVYMVGRDLYLPEGAMLFNVSGTRVAATNLADGIYIIRFADASSMKFLVK